VLVRVLGVVVRVLVHCSVGVTMLVLVTAVLMLVLMVRITVTVLVRVGHAVGMGMGVQMLLGHGARVRRNAEPLRRSRVSATASRR
jgi:hypothetical protein